MYNINNKFINKKNFYDIRPFFYKYGINTNKPYIMYINKLGSPNDKLGKRI